MKTATISTRLTAEEGACLDALALESGLDRANLMKLFLRNGMRDMQMDLAVKAYASERVTLSRAAEMAGVSVSEFLARMPEQRLELSYDVSDLETDLRTLGLS